jgi:hypothetical protein
MSKSCLVVGGFLLLALVTQACREKAIHNFQPPVQSWIQMD